MAQDKQLEEILSLYDGSEYPEGFYSQYTFMECLSERNGICTLLVQDRDGDRFIAKCYSKSAWTMEDNSAVLSGLDHPGLPKNTAVFENEGMKVMLREYIEGTSLDRYADERGLNEKEITDICVRLCDILAYLHHRETPVIHRDVKPQNIIVKENGDIVLIDFDIARMCRRGSASDTDTVVLGTPAYAPPEQFGFAQTDARSDIFSLGVLLRRLLTGSVRENKNIKIYRPLDAIIRKCTAFSPEERYGDVSQVKKALLRSEPKKRTLRIAAQAAAILAAACLLLFAGIKIYKALTYTPFKDGAIPAYMTDEERAEDAVKYMKRKYSTDMFDDADRLATVGDLRAALTGLYGLDREYVYGINEGMPTESDEFFLPWGWDDGQYLAREPMIYAAVKVHDPSIVADWSDIKDDNGFYPGMRAAAAFAEKTGISTGASRPMDITMGDMAIILANADRVFESAEKTEK